MTNAESFEQPITFTARKLMRCEYRLNELPFTNELLEQGPPFVPVACQCEPIDPRRSMYTKERCMVCSAL